MNHCVIEEQCGNTLIKCKVSGEESSWHYQPADKNQKNVLINERVLLLAIKNI